MVTGTNPERDPTHFNTTEGILGVLQDVLFISKEINIVKHDWVMCKFPQIPVRVQLKYFVLEEEE